MGFLSFASSMGGVCLTSGGGVTVENCGVARGGGDDAGELRADLTGGRCRVCDPALHGLLEFGVVDGEVVLDVGEGDDARELRVDLADDEGQLDAVYVFVVGEVRFDLDRAGGRIALGNGADKQAAFGVKREQAGRTFSGRGFDDP